MSSDTDLCQITALCSILQPMNHVQCHVDTWCVTPQFLGKNEQRSPPVIVYPALWNQEGHQAVTTVTLLCFDPQKRSPLLSVLLLAHFTPQYPILGLRPPSSPRAPLIVLSGEWDPDSIEIKPAAPVWCALSNLLGVFLRGPSILDLERMRCDGSRCSPKSLDIDVSASLPGLNVNVFVYVCICAGVLLAPSFVFVHVCFFIQLWNLNSTLNNPTLNVL